MRDLISKKARREFQESYVRNSVLRIIESDFRDAGLEPQELPEDSAISGQRRTLVEEYYVGVNWRSPRQVRKVLDAFESHLLSLEDDGQEDQYRRLLRYLERDGIQYEIGRLTLPGASAGLDELVDHGLEVDLSQVDININRIRDAVEDDPALAIGSSKELVESCCKAILEELGIAYEASLTIPQLVRKAVEALELLPGEVPDGKKGAKSIKKVLGSLANIVQGIAELRNLYGSGHGKGPTARGLGSRHARLCAGAAATLARFLVETAQFKKQSTGSKR